MELASHNLVRYLEERKLIKNPGAVRIEWMSGGVINRIFGVRSGRRRMVIKQASSTAKFDASISLHPRRMKTEARALGIVRKLAGKHVPKVLYFDEKNSALAMERVPEGYELLTYQLCEGRPDARLAKNLGAFYGRLHDGTFKNRKLGKEFPISETFVKLKMGLYHEELLRSLKTDAQRALVRGTMRLCLENRICLCHGDALPKNIYVDGADFIVLDWETAVFGDPAHDIGTLISNYMLGALINYPLRERYFACIRSFMRAYARSVRFKDLLATIERSAARHIAPTLYGRAAGKIRPSFIKSQTRQAMLQIAGDLVRRDPHAIGDIPKILEQRGQALQKNAPIPRERIRGMLF